MQKNKKQVESFPVNLLKAIIPSKHDKGLGIMAKIEFLGPINKEPLVVNISHLSELKSLFGSDPALKEWLSCSAIAVNDKLVSNLNLSISKNDKITLLPPVCGG